MVLSLVLQCVQVQFLVFYWLVSFLAVSLTGAELSSAAHLHSWSRSAVSSLSVVSSLEEGALFHSIHMTTGDGGDDAGQTTSNCVQQEPHVDAHPWEHWNDPQKGRCSRCGP